MTKRLRSRARRMRRFELLEGRQLLASSSDIQHLVSQQMETSDLNTDGSVDQTDFQILADRFGATSEDPTNLLADIDRDGSVGFSDFLILSADFADQRVESQSVTDADVTPSLPGPPPGGFSIESLVSGLFNPTAFAYAPDGQIFIAEDQGMVQHYSADGQHTGVFLDLSEQVNHNGDRGLLGIAVDPNFANNGRIYLNYTEDLGGIEPDSESPAGGRLIRVEASASNPNVADPSTITTLVTGFVSKSLTHSIGAIHFDTTGMLIAAYGDGAQPGNFDPPFGVDPMALDALDLDVLNGKYIRIDPETGHGVPGNPYYDSSNPDSVRSKVIARGVRNAFRFTVDEVTGDIWFGDVGWRHYEEINRIPRPDTITDPDRTVNFGWPCREGEFPQDRYSVQFAECDAYTEDNTADPLYAWRFPGGGAALSGPVWRGSVYPAEWQNQLFFADFAQDAFYTRDVFADLRSYPDAEAPVGNLFGTPAADGSFDYFAPVDMQIGPDGRIHFLSWIDGSLKRLVHSSVPADDAIGRNDFNATDEIVNGSFEFPNVPPGENENYIASRIPGWQGEIIEVLGMPNSGVPNATDGDQVAELNRGQSKRIFQDLNTTPGETLTISFDHRGAEEVETLMVKAGHPNATNTIGTFSAPTGSWTAQSVTYVVPSGQTVTRIEWDSDMDSPEGNLLDDIRVVGSAGNNTPPVARVDAPGAGFTYDIGDAININLSGSDAEDGTLSGSDLSWEVRLIHLSHEHAINFGSGASTSFTTSDHGSDDTYYVIDVTATDSQGAKSTSRREIRPNRAPVSITSNPPGVAVVYDASTTVTPISVQSIVGGGHSAFAPTNVTLGAQSYVFDGWTGGGTVSASNVSWTVAETGLQLVANYLPVGGPDNQSPTAVINASPTAGVAPLTVSFSAANSSDPDSGDTLSYAWDFTNDGITDATGVSAVHTFTGGGEFSAKLTVTDSSGASDTTTETISVTSGPVLGNEIINGGFESPDVPDGDKDDYLGPLIPGWTTTKLVIWDGPQRNIVAAAGEQFAELNRGGKRIYQDISTTPGETLTISFAHRGRETTETLQLLAGTPTQTTNLATLSAGTNQWTTQTVRYVVPSGQTTTRIEWVSEMASNKGNLIDDVRITRDAFLPGDANFDGRVNFLDFARLSSNFGTTTGATWSEGDFTGDGMVNFSDFVVIANNFTG